MPRPRSVVVVRNGIGCPTYEMMCWSGRLEGLKGGETPPLRGKCWIFDMEQRGLFEDDHLSGGGVISRL